MIGLLRSTLARKSAHLFGLPTGALTRRLHVTSEIVWFLCAAGDMLEDLFGERGHEAVASDPVTELRVGGQLPMGELTEASRIAAMRVVSAA